MCCVGGQDGLQVENRLTSVEKYLDDFVVKFEDEEDVEDKVLLRNEGEIGRYNGVIDAESRCGCE